MKTLLRSFLQFTTASVALAVVVNTLLVRFGDKIVDAFYAPGTLGSELVGYGLSLGVYVSIAYALPVLLYRRVLWKWFHPRLCFAGYWKGRVGYAAAVRPSNGDLVSVEPAPPRDLCVEISQDALEIHFGSGHGEMAENWKTPLIDIVDERIHFVYVARRQAAPDSALASYTVGYEEWDVMERDWRGRPTVCSAPFHQCFIPGVPLSHGTAEWTRLSKNEFNQLVRQFREQRALRTADVKKEGEPSGGAYGSPAAGSPSAHP
jgi:hypothetical protein